MKKNARRRGTGVLGGIGYLAIVALLVLATVNLYRPVQTSYRLGREISAARARLTELKVLHPLYRELIGLERPAQWPDLQLPAPERLDESEVTATPERFMALAEASRLELATVSPRVETDARDGHRYLAVELHASGAYPQLRVFLMALARMPVLERIERIEVKRTALHEEILVLARLALEGGTP